MRAIIPILFGLVLQANVLYGQLIIDYNTLSINEIDKSQFDVGKFINVQISHYCDTCDKFTVEITGEQYENTSGIDAFKKINEIRIETETNTENYHLLSLQIPDKDKSIIKITRYKPDGVTKLEERSYFFRNKGGIKLDVSSGFFVTSLRDENFVLKSTSDNTKQIIKENNGSIRTGIGLLAHLHFRSQSWSTFGVTGGFEINNDAKVGYLAGLSWFIGHDRKFVLSGGAVFGKVKRISEVYQVGDVVSSEINVVPTTEIWKQGWFGSLTYNF
jgi:hypothetical protein